MASSSRETGESSTDVPAAASSDESVSFYGFEFATYAYNEIVRGMESKNINTNKYVQQIFAACKKDPNPSSVILGNQLEKTKEKYKESEKVARAESSEYRYIPEVLSQMKRTNAITRIYNVIKAEGVPHSVKRRNQAVKLWKMNYPNLHNCYSRNQKQEWFNWVLSVPKTTSYYLSSMGISGHGCISTPFDYYLMSIMIALLDKYRFTTDKSIPRVLCDERLEMNSLNQIT